MKSDRESSLAELPGWKAALEQVAGPLNAAIQNVAFATGISDRDLEKQLLLHLPRFSPAGLAEPGRIRLEAERPRGARAAVAVTVRALGGSGTHPNLSESGNPGGPLQR